ncbi:hypothetical protein [Geodermatophilus sp. SYSU D00815]
MKTPAALSAALVLACLPLTACGGDDVSEAAAAGSTSRSALPPTTSTAPTTTAATPSHNERNNIVKQLGQEGGFADTTGKEQVFSFAVDNITVNPVCDSGFAQPPANGHYIAVDIRASTTANYTEQGIPVLFTADQFQVIGPDGVTVTSLNGNSYSCLHESRRITQDFLGDAQQYRGTVILDSPVDHGSLVFLVAGTDGGWEWTF